MSPSRTEWAVIPETESWRPMAFGFKDARRIKDPVCEPLWSGERILVEVNDRAVRLRDTDGSTVEGFQDLEDAIADAVTAAEVVIDGYLMPAPIGAQVDDASLVDMPNVPSAGQMARQFMLGSIGSNRYQDQLDAAESRIVAVSANEPAAFVAIDLLWLDRESLIDIPLAERKRLLDSVVAERDLVRRTVNVKPPVETWYRQWRSFGFREFAVKDANSRYTPGGESDLWTTVAIPRR